MTAFCVGVVVLTVGVVLHAQQTPQQVIDELRAVILQQQQALEQILRKLQDALRPPQEPSTSIIAEPGRLQQTIDGAAAGATVFLRPGVIYNEHIVIRKAVTLDTLDLTLAAGYRVVDEDKPRLAHLAAANNGPLVDIVPGVADVSIRRLWVGPSNANAIIQCGRSDATQTTVEQQPRRIAFHQVIVEGDDRPGATGAKRAFELNCRDVVIADSRCADVRRVGQDTQCVGAWNTEGPIVIRNSYLEAAGENVMFGGAAPSIPGIVPRTLELSGSFLTKDLAWRAIGATVKNHFEVKVGEGVIVRGNRMENMWAAGQSYSIMLTPQAQDAPNPNCIVANVLIEDNELVDVSGGINIRGREQLGTPCLQGSDVTVRRNWLRIRRTLNGGSGQGWAFFLNGRAQTVTIEQNTVESDANHFIFQDGDPVLGLRVVGNLFGRGWAYGMAGTVNGSTSHFAIGMQTWAPGAVVSGNGIVAFARPGNLPNNLHIPCVRWNLDRTNCLEVPPGLIVDGYGVGELAPYGRPR